MLKTLGLGFIGGIFFGVGHINLLHNVPAIIGAACYFGAGYLLAKKNV